MTELGTAGATIGDVARVAGVSRATVSRVMNGRRVAPELTERVQRVAAELDYRPSVLARSLSLGRTQAVGVVVPDLTNPMFQEVLRGIAAASDAAGYGMVVAETQERAESEAEIIRSTSSRVDALVLVSPRAPSAVLAAVAGHGVPVVLVNRTLTDVDVPAVSVDYADAAYGAVEYLTDLGHRSIVYLAGPPNAASNADRLAGLATARASFAGISLIELTGGVTMTDGYVAAAEVLATGATAVVAYDDLVAFGLLARLRELGVDVPGRVSVLGFDDAELARFGTPALTTVAVPHGELGRRAWARLAERLGAAAGAGTAGSGSAVEVVRTRLVVRASTGPSPERTTDPRPRAAGADAGAPSWRRDVTGTTLRLDGAPLAGWVSGAHLPADRAPRPYLHPIRALGGARLTAAAPVDDRRQHGLSLLLDDARGSSRDAAVDPDDPGTLRDVVDWVGAGSPDERWSERRALRARTIPGGWALRWESGLTSVDSARQTPRARLHWRFPAMDEVRLASAEVAGDDARLSTAPWIALALRSADAWTTVVLIREAGGAWEARTDPAPAVSLAASVDGVAMTALLLDGLHLPEAVADRWYPAAVGLFDPARSNDDEAPDAR